MTWMVLLLGLRLRPCEPARAIVLLSLSLNKLIFIVIFKSFYTM
jgi:hypothetical protein